MVDSAVIDLEDALYILNKICKLYFPDCSICELKNHIGDKCSCEIPFDAEIINGVVHDYIRSENQACLH